MREVKYIDGHIVQGYSTHRIGHSHYWGLRRRELNYDNGEEVACLISLRYSRHHTCVLPTHIAQDRTVLCSS